MSAPSSPSEALPVGSGTGRWILAVGSRRWLLAVLLVLPATIPYLSHYLGAGGLQPTGFIQADQPGYMAVAREYFEGGGVRFLYGNPFSPDYSSPRLYFQPQTFLLGLGWEISDADPGLIFVLFGLLAALVCARTAIALYEATVGLRSPFSPLGLVLFFWGGGLLVLGGLLTTPAAVFRHGGALMVGSTFRFDPFDGWWFLNFGRNLIFPLESYYHALFFGTMVVLVKRQFTRAAVLIVVLAVSHPYSGAELLAVVTGWGFFEVFLRRRDVVPVWFFIATLATLAVSAWYYLLFLPQWLEHRGVVERWTRGWNLELSSAFAAYGLVGAFAIVAAFRRGFFLNPANRLLVVWFGVAFLMAKHDWFTGTPLQPLHFTRGYIWTPLFLMGVPVLLGLFESWRRTRKPLLQGGIVLLSLVFLADNAAWFTAVGRSYLIEHVWLTQGQRQVLDCLSRPENAGALVVASDNTIAYLSTVYTPLRPWSSFRLVESSDERRREQVQRFFLHGEYPAAWRGKRLLLVVDSVPDSLAVRSRASVLGAVPGGVRGVCSNPEYGVYEVEGDK
jgi:hypothetical protein